MIDIVIADNQPLTHEGLKAMLSGIIDIRVTGTARSTAELEGMVTRLKPQVIIIDPNHSHHFSIHDIKRITSGPASAQILVLTNRKPKSEILQILNSGVKNYVIKECSREELIYAIYTTAKGEQFYCKNTFETLFGNKLIPEKETDIPTLSVRETELIHLVAEGLTNKEIAEKLFLSIHTVKTHRKNIIKKLGFTFKNTAEFAAFIQSGN